MNGKIRVFYCLCLAIAGAIGANTHAQSPKLVNDGPITSGKRKCHLILAPTPPVAGGNTQRFVPGSGSTNTAPRAHWSVDWSLTPQSQHSDHACIALSVTPSNDDAAARTAAQSLYLVAPRPLTMLHLFSFAPGGTYQPNVTATYPTTYCVSPGEYYVSTSRSPASAELVVGCRIEVRSRFGGAAGGIPTKPRSVTVPTQ